MTSALILLCGLSLASALHTTLDWSDCGSDPGLTLRTIEATPMPVTVPGPLTLTIDADIGRALDEVDITLDIKRHTFLVDLPIPCLFHVGSCTYHSSCQSGSLLDTMVTEDWAGIMANIGGQVKTMVTQAGIRSDVCPLPATTLNIQRFTINLPEVPSILHWFAAGDYSALVHVRDTPTGQNLMCLRLGFTIHQ